MKKKKMFYARWKERKEALASHSSAERRGERKRERNTSLSRWGGSQRKDSLFLCGGEGGDEREKERMEGRWLEKGN